MADEARNQEAQDQQLGDAWGDDISPERQAELEATFQRQAEWVVRPEAVRGDSAFKEVRLTGADVFWLAGRKLAGDNKMVAWHLARMRQSMLGLMLMTGLRLNGLHLEGADLSEAHLEGAFLAESHLEGAFCLGTHFEGASLAEAHLERTILGGAYMKDANLREAHLEGATLAWARLENAVLQGAHLEGTDIREAHLEGADLSETHVEGRAYTPDDADYQRIRPLVMGYSLTLPPPDLRGAFLDYATNLKGAILGVPGNGPGQGYVRVADVHWGGANLAVVKDWPAEMLLGDEREAWAWQPPKREAAKATTTMAGKHSRKDLAEARRQREQKWRGKVAEARQERLELFRAAVRANRQLATALRNQGMNEEADRFAYRAQVCQRQVYRLSHQRVRRAFSWLLDALAGYGYRPERSLYAYLLSIFGFGVAYFVLGHLSGPVLSPIGAFVYSMTSFHGRGFFPGGIALDDPMTVLAALEAFVGLVIEVSFIATFTQRFFGK